MAKKSIVKPGLFGQAFAADARRFEFDGSNEALIRNGMRPDAVFIGDSITHAWDLQAYFGTGKLLVNRGIGGDISAAVARRFEADTLQLQPKLIVMKIGTNDLGWGMGFPNASKVQVILDSVSAMAKAAKARGIPMAICSILPIWGPNWYPLPEFASKKNRLIAKTNSGLKSLAKSGGHIYVDYHSQMLDQDGLLRHDLAADGIHPGWKGYCIMRDVLRATLSPRGFEI